MILATRSPSSSSIAYQVAAESFLDVRTQRGLSGMMWEMFMKSLESARSPERV